MYSPRPPSSGFKIEGGKKQNTYSNLLCGIRNDFAKFLRVGESVVK
jgi:hypothetical protein